jgi:hypothetical protein
MGATIFLATVCQDWQLNFSDSQLSVQKTDEVLTFRSFAAEVRLPV